MCCLEVCLGVSVLCFRYDVELEKTYLKKMRMKVQRVLSSIGKLSCVHCPWVQLGLVKEEDDDSDLIQSLLDKMHVTGQLKVVV